MNEELKVNIERIVAEISNADIELNRTRFDAFYSAGVVISFVLMFLAMLESSLIYGVLAIFFPFVFMHFSKHKFSLDEYKKSLIPFGFANISVRNRFFSPDIYSELLIKRRNSKRKLKEMIAKEGFDINVMKNFLNLDAADDIKIILLERYNNELKSK